MFNRIAALLAATFLLAGCSQSAAQLQQSANVEVQRISTTVENDASSLKIKGALMASSKLDSQNIHVYKDGKTFFLRGSAISLGQKELAGQIARDTSAKDERLVNELKVEATPKPTAQTSPTQADKK